MSPRGPTFKALRKPAYKKTRFSGMYKKGWIRSDALDVSLDKAMAIEKGKTHETPNRTRRAGFLSAIDRVRPD